MFSSFLAGFTVNWILGLVQGPRPDQHLAVRTQDHKKRNGRDLHLLPQELDYVALNPDKQCVFITSSLLSTEMKKGQSANQMLSSKKELYEN